MPKLKINGIEVDVAPGASVLQACEQLGIEIPRFCYHDRLSVAGNCRMCLVEIEKSPKPMASCALPAAEGMVVRTDTPSVQKSRRGVMEMLLINHPLDCPICDQGGECDLQDQAMAYGFDRGRYEEDKRAVKDKDLGPLIKTVMTRCIQCTRCIRFADEIAGASELGAFGRGENMEIGTYISRAVTSELSGNLIDVCPVGALTSRPYAFRARPWELVKTETIDVMDAVGSNIRVDARGQEVLRVLPRLHEEVNEEWISDKTRFACDGLRRQRLDQPYRRNAEGRLVPCAWPEALSAVTRQMQGLPGAALAAIAGDLCAVEEVFALKVLMQSLGSPWTECRQDGAQYDASVRAGYLFNSGIAGIGQADVILLVGTNPRHEAPLVNARIRKRWRAGGVKIGLVGEKVDLTYPVQHLGAGPRALEDIMQGRNPFAALLRGAKNPMMILGAGALARKDGASIHFRMRQFAESLGLVREGWNGFNVLQLAAGRAGALDLGFVPAGGKGLADIYKAAESGQTGLVYLLGADEIDTGRLGRAFVVYQGHHGDKGAERADVILPGAAYTEKNALYVNTEGRVQAARRAVFPPGQAREDWKILRALSESVGRKLAFDSHAQLRKMLTQMVPHFARLDEKPVASWAAFGRDGVVDPVPFTLPVRNFHQTDVISRASVTMAECVAAFNAPAREAAE